MSRFSDAYLRLTDLVQAYRKAKADCFQEKSLTTSIRFAEYETHLYRNLRTLLGRLTDPRGRWFTDPKFIGGHVFVPKSLDIEATGPSSAGHFISTDPVIAWRQVTRSGRPRARFRPVVDFTVPMHIISALWVNKVGDRLDACLDKSAYGARMRRIRSDDRSQRHGAYHIDAVGSFERYFHAYRSWRRHGITAARQAMSAGHAVIILTMDLQSYYHNIDPSFALNTRFLEALGLEQDEGLSGDDRRLTEQLLSAFRVWGGSIPGNSEGAVGLPVGASASRVLSNVLLGEFDRSVQESLTPLFYGRYVDDIFLVLKATASMTDADAVMRHCVARVPLLSRTEDGWSIDLPYAGESRLNFQQRKQRFFHLTPDAGPDLLDVIERRIREVSSEWRMLPDPDDLEQSPAARVLVASRDPGDEADSLTRADQLSVRRLGFSVLMSGCDTLSQDLPRDEWKPQRRQLYRFIESYVLTPLRLFDLHDYVGRVMGIAIATRDWLYAKKFIGLIRDALQMLERRADGLSYEWAGLRRFFANGLFEAACRAFPAADTGLRVPKLLCETLTEVRALADNDPAPVSADEVLSVARAIDCSDLGRLPLKERIDVALMDSSFNRRLAAHDDEAWRREGVQEFLRLTRRDARWTMRLLFPTRPHTPTEIAEQVRKCVFDRDLWRRLTRAIRGVWVRNTRDDGDDGDSAGDRNVVLETHHTRSKPLLAVTSYHVSELSWHAAAAGRPDLSRVRYSRLAKLANAILKAEHRPDYVLFPELAIPRRWIGTLADSFLKEGISLIAGVEYEVKGNHVVNEAKLFLTDRSLGYGSYLPVTQTKDVPAHGERDHLRSHHGRAFPPPASLHSPRPLYVHGSLVFGLLLCSELTKAEYRAEFRGNIDALFVLSWNQDIESFGSLIESAALDIHGFQVIVNNRMYGDSRVRAPYRERWLRDGVRVRGGLDDYFVVCELDVTSLREYQSHAEPNLNGRFKPTPEGFKIAPGRRRVPGSVS